MAKSRSFSIFLLKEHYTTSRNALKPGHGLKKATPSHNDAPTWPTYLSLSSPTTPWWRSYFAVSDPVTQGFAGAVVFIEASERTFALTFGHTRHKLREEAYEYDFGLRTTLNAVDPKEIRNTDELDPATARRRRTQLPDRSDINYFDFDADSAILRSLTGAIRPEYKTLFSHATGASNLRVSTTRGLNDLPDLLSEIYAVYQKDTYLTAFPAATNIQPIKDPTALKLLDRKLEAAFGGGSYDLSLTIPDLLDFQDDFEVSYTGLGRCDLYPDAAIADYYGYLTRYGRSPDTMRVDDLRRHRLCICTTDGDIRGDYSIYKSLVFETSLEGDGAAYHLSEGTWYRVDADYLATLDHDLAPLFVDGELPARTEHLEANYNELQLVPHWPGSVLLDKTDTSPRGQTQVEPCDVARSESGELVLTHVKLGVGASDLSHLFNQGTTAADLLLGLPDARTRLGELIKAREPQFDLAGLEHLRLRVEYVIVTKKDASLGPAALPLFSRISLRRANRALTSMKTPATVILVRDDCPAVPRQKPRKKTKPFPSEEHPSQDRRSAVAKG